jgi:predicted DNA-binding transcriptional regulator AlpA
MIEAAGKAVSPEVLALFDELGDRLVQALASPRVGPDRRLVDKRWLAAYFSLSVSSVDRIVAQPGFPAARKLPGGPLRWVEEEVTDWALQHKR